MKIPQAPPLYEDIVAAAEQTGRLAAILGQVLPDGASATSYLPWDKLSG